MKSAIEPTVHCTAVDNEFRLGGWRIVVALGVAVLLIPAAFAARGVPAVGAMSGGIVPISAAAVAAGLVSAALLHATGAHKSGTAELVVFGVILFGIVFQAVHFLEHVAQLGYWIMHPSEKPWLTPWAATAVDGLAFLGRGPADPRAAAAALEYLHLVGNGIFFAGVLLLDARLSSGSRSVVARRSARRALVWQAVHFGEHVLLVSTLVVSSSALGASTLFGFADPAQPAMWTFRVVVHFALNAVPTYYATKAVVLARNELAGAYRGRRPRYEIGS